MSFCGECGTENPDTNSFCKNCGKALRKPQAPAPQTTPAVPGAAPAPALQPASPAPAPQEAQPAHAEKKPMASGMKFAIGSIIFGIIAFLYMPYIAAIIGIVLGVLAVRSRTMAGAVGIVLCIAAVIADNLMLVLLAP